MTRNANPLAASYRHGLRVRMGRIDGPRGVLWQCEKKDGGTYWRVRLQGTANDWCWPNERGGIIVDGPGDAVNSSCAQCDLPFVMVAGSGELLCQRCNDETFGRLEDRASDPPPARRWNDRRRWIRGKHA